jgi:hypothetical protein
MRQHHEPLSNKAKVLVSRAKQDAARVSRSGCPTFPAGRLTPLGGVARLGGRRSKLLADSTFLVVLCALQMVELETRAATLKLV